ncbi:MAG: hypothetical protein ACXVOI_11995, partial [Tumebacillaceae bacterium]
SEKGPEWVDVISGEYGEIEEALGFKPFERTDYIATFSLHDERFRVEYRKQPTWGLPFKRDTIYEIDLMTPPQAAIPPYPYHHTLDSHKQNAPL